MDIVIIIENILNNIKKSYELNDNALISLDSGSREALFILESRNILYHIEATLKNYLKSL